MNEVLVKVKVRNTLVIVRIRENFWVRHNPDIL